MIYAQENYALMFEEIQPLLTEHYLEIAKYQDIPLEPDWDVYKAMETLGILKCFSCRDDVTKELQGYAIYFVKNHLHYKGCLVAQQDILFITKEKRGSGLRFILWCDDRLKEMGVQMVVQHVKAATPKTVKLMERLGYEIMDFILTKRLDKQGA